MDLALSPQDEAFRDEVRRFLEENLSEDLREAGLTGLRVEGMPHCDWVLIDAGDVIVHVFRPEVRTFYNLERLWTRGRNTGRAS